MAVLKKAEIQAALHRVAELAHAEGIAVELLVVGGAAMVLGFVAAERDWPADWLNEGAKAYLARSNHERFSI
jgi:hypothetical protein